MKTSTVRRVTVGALLVLALVLVPAAIAAKGGNGGRPGGGGSTATLYASCNPCAAGSVASFWGSGYNGSLGTAQLSVSGTWAGIPVAADGTVSFSWYLAASGTYELKIYQSGTGRKTALKGQLIVVAQ